MNISAIPNLLTSLRIVLVVPIVWTLVEERYPTALLLFLVAGITDGLDGFIAKRFGWITRLGSILDPLADKILLMASYLILGWHGHLPFWLVSLVILRDLIIVAGFAVYNRQIAQVNLSPLIISKINTFAQIMLGLIVIMALTWGGAFPD